MAKKDVNVFINGHDKASPAFNKTGKSTRGLDKNLKNLASTTNATGNQINKSSRSISSSLSELTASYGRMGINAGINFLKSSFEEFGNQQKALAKLNQTLKATKGAAGISSEGLQAHAKSLQKVTTFGKSTIIEGQALLATFKEIKGPIFKGATRTMLDMSAALGQDLKSSAIQLGKALNAPITGVAALSEVGVSFTEEQKKMITVMVEANDVAGAQAVILNELASEFGGVAEAIAKTDIGKVEQLANTWGEFKGKIGGFWAPKLNDILSFWTERLKSDGQKANDKIDAIMRQRFALLGGQDNKTLERLEAGRARAQQTGNKKQLLLIEKVLAAEREKIRVAELAKAAKTKALVIANDLKEEKKKADKKAAIAKKAADAAATIAKNQLESALRLEGELTKIKQKGILSELAGIDEKLRRNLKANVANARGTAAAQKLAGLEKENVIAKFKKKIDEEDKKRREKFGVKSGKALKEDATRLASAGVSGTMVSRFLTRVPGRADPKWSQDLLRGMVVDRERRKTLMEETESQTKEIRRLIKIFEKMKIVTVKKK